MKNLSESEIYPAFSTPIYKNNIKYYMNNIIDFNNINFDEYYWEGMHPNLETNGQVLVSKNQNILLDERYKTIRDYCDSAMSQYVYDILKVSSKVNLKLVCSWVLIGYPGSLTHKHLHQNSVFSGIFYLKSGKESGDLLLTHPLSIPTAFSPTVFPNLEEYNILNSRVFVVTPKTNDIIIFPSHVYHEVTRNISDEVRCCIAFNYFLDGQISNDNTEHLNITINNE